MSNLLRAVVIAGAVALTLSGCGAADTADSGKPKVLTTFTVVADMVRQVAGDRVEVASITKPGAEIHGYEPTPSDLKHAACSRTGWGSSAGSSSSSIWPMRST